MITDQKFEDAKKILRQIGEINGKPLTTFTLLEEYEYSHHIHATTSRKHGLLAIHEHPADKSHGYGELISERRLRKTTIATSFIFFALYYCYYGAVMAINSMAAGTSLGLVAFLFNVAEISAYALSSTYPDIME